MSDSLDAMDLLADLLRQSGLTRRVLEQRSFFRAVQLQFPCERSIGFHVVTHGQAYIHLVGKKTPVQLQTGDIALMSRGQRHIIATESQLRPVDARFLGQEEHHKTSERGVFPGALSAEKIKLSLVSGAYQLWHDPIHPFFKELPDWFLIRKEEIESFDRISAALGLLSQEVAQKEIGSEQLTESLLDILFTYILRKVIHKTQAQPKTWSHALQDPRILNAIQLMHADCAKPWTLEELAAKVGVSRAGFAQKFKATMGKTPLQYLTGLRIQRAIDLLIHTDEKIDTVATAVGYQDAFGFSKVFKKITGVPPRMFRDQDRRERDRKIRF